MSDNTNKIGIAIVMRQTPISPKNINSIIILFVEKMSRSKLVCNKKSDVEKYTTRQLPKCSHEG